MFVDSLHINRWLCGDNAQHFCADNGVRPRGQHTPFLSSSSLLFFCVCLFLIPSQSEGAFINVSISEEERQSLSGV